MTFPAPTAYGLVAGYGLTARRPLDTEPIAEPNTGDWLRRSTANPKSHHAEGTDG
jgi:hypothetical protein